MFISSAFAQTAGAAAPQPDLIGMLMPIALIFLVFYFLLIRPQQKRLKEHQDMVGNLRRGDKVVTAGGIIGTVSRLQGDEELQIEISDGVRIRVRRNSITEVLSKPQPANDKGSKSSDSKAKSDKKDKGNKKDKADIEDFAEGEVVIDADKSKKDKEKDKMELVNNQ